MSDYIHLPDAAADLELLRPQAMIAIGGDLPEDEPIRAAWAIALSRFRAACEHYVEALGPKP